MRRHGPHLQPNGERAYCGGPAIFLAGRRYASYDYLIFKRLFQEGNPLA